MSGSLQRDKWDVAVVGGGIVGLSTALELQSRGYSVVVIDRDRPRERASFGNAGVIGRGSVLTVAGPGIWRDLLGYATNRHPALKIRYRSLPHVARWLIHFLRCCNETAWRRSARALSPLTAAAFDNHQRLADLVGATELIRRDGFLKLFRGPPMDATSILERHILEEVGVRAVLLDAAELRDLEPFLSNEFTHALFFPENGSVRSPGRLIELYGKTFRERGGALVVGEAKALDYGESAIGIALEGQRLSATRVVVAAGAWSARLLAPLGYRIPFAAERGYHVQFNLRAGESLNRPIQDAGASYAAAPIENGVRVLSGIELAAPDDPPNDRQLGMILDAARASLPLAEMTSEPRWMGSRPSTADGLPVIGESSRHKRLLLAFGHGHIGFSTGPTTGRIVADLIAGRPPQVPIAPFSIERFT